MNIELICLDMAGTTVNDQGLVLAAFRRTIDELGVTDEDAVAAEAYVIETMGQSKIEVFRELFNERAELANDAFERHFVRGASDVGVNEVPGARATIEELKSRGLVVALTTGFSPGTREVLIDILGWADLVPIRVSPADAGRGRPAPDMLLVCALRARVSAMANIAVVGDTASDMQAGRRAGASECIGVLTGTDNAARLFEHGAHAVVDSVADLIRIDSFVA
ncbi:MAG TPA: HAD family hydrolase [Acidimicrobiales bacterium]|nr:HAD family hydrolase [Acidimicrobiales bacterium]